MNTSAIRPPFQTAADLVLVGASPAIATIRSAIDKLVASQAPVLLCGETGTGKELVARLIHLLSSRRTGPFVAFNCAAQPDGPFASRVAAGPDATGTDTTQNASRSRADAAVGGTLFLDEVGDLSPSGQLDLLRVLDGSGPAQSESGQATWDIRIITANHGELSERCASGQFRDDLYFRLSALQLRIPPLRERDDDADLLAGHFLASFAAQHGRPELRFGDAAWRALRACAWPGNVRELRNRVLQATIMCDGNVVTPEHLAFDPADVPEATPNSAGRESSTTSLRERRLMAERDAITEALRDSHGQVPMAASSLGISRAQLYRLIGRLRLPHRPQDYN